MKTIRNLALALAVLLPGIAPAALNEGVLTYAGYLKTSAGAAETTPQSLTFTLYDAATAGNTVWTQTVSVTPDSQGWFSAVLGASPSAFPNADFLNQTWLGIKVGTEVEMSPRTKVGAAPHALSMEYAGLSGCTTANQILQWSGTAWACIATPAGGSGGGGVTGVTATAPVASSGGTAPVISLTGCAAANQILQWSGTAWACIATPSGGSGGGVTGVTATAPVVSSGGAAPVISLPAASASASGYLSSGDWSTFNGKLAAPSAACAAGTHLTWSGTALSCVADANTTYTAGTGLALSGTAFSVNTATIQARVSGTCTAGATVASVNADGTVTCSKETLGYMVQQVGSIGSVNSPASTWTLLYAFPTSFTKVQAGTILEVELHGTFALQTAAVINWPYMQVTMVVGGSYPAAGEGGVLRIGDYRSYTTGEYLASTGSIVARYANLTAGAKAISLYVRSNVASGTFIVNPGGFPEDTYIHVKERWP